MPSPPSNPDSQTEQDRIMRQLHRINRALTFALTILCVWLTARAAETAPTVPRALLLGALKPGWLLLAQDLACAAVVTDYRLMDKTVAALIHKVGLRALVYTVNDETAAARLIADGVDGIITDAVDRFAPA